MISQDLKRAENSMMFVSVLLNKYNIFIFSMFTNLYVTHINIHTQTGAILTNIRPLITAQRHDKTRAVLYITISYVLYGFFMGEKN